MARRTMAGRPPTACRLRRPDWADVQPALVQSRELSFYAGLVLLPFFLAVMPPHPWQVIILVGMLLAPQTAGFVLTRRGSHALALNVQLGLSILLAVGCLASGFGLALCVTLILLAAIDYFILSPQEGVGFGKMSALLVILLMMISVAAKISSDAQFLGLYVPSLLTLLPVSIQVFVGVLSFKNSHSGRKRAFDAGRAHGSGLARPVARCRLHARSRR